MSHVGSRAVVCLGDTGLARGEIQGSSGGV